MKILVRILLLSIIFKLINTTSHVKCTQGDEKQKKRKEVLLSQWFGFMVVALVMKYSKVDVLLLSKASAVFGS